jgi:hypothetical protein
MGAIALFSHPTDRCVVNVNRPTLLRYFGSVVAMLEFRFGA